MFSNMYSDIAIFYYSKLEPLKGNKRGADEATPEKSNYIVR